MHVGAGDHQIGEAVVNIPLHHIVTLAVAQGKIAGGRLCHLEHRIVLLAFADAVQHVAGGEYETTVDVDAAIGINARVAAGGAALGIDAAAVDDQIAIGINAVTLAGLACYHNIQRAAVDGGDGNVIFVGVDAVVAGADFDITAVDGQMQLGIQPLVGGIDIQVAVCKCAVANVHGHSGIHGAVIFMQLLGIQNLCAVFIEHHRVRLVDLSNIAAAYGASCSVGEDDVGTGLGGVYIGTGQGFRLAAAFVNIVENDGGGDGAGDGRVHQHQIYFCAGIFVGFFAQIHGDLALAELAAEDVLAGLRDMHHGVGGGLLGAVGIGFSTFAVGKVVTGFVVNNVIGDIHGLGAVGGSCNAVHGDAAVTQDDIGALVFFLRRQNAATEECGDHGHGQNEYPCAFHNRTSR